MSESKQFANLLGTIWGAPEEKVVDARGAVLDDLVAKVRAGKIVKVAAEDEARCIELFSAAGAIKQPQYEAVRAGADDPTVLETVAKARAESGDTSAAIARDTDFHQDGYQFWHEYRHAKVAGIGNMPDLELLSFPKVVEGRFLVFSDLARAARRFLTAHESSQLEVLTRARFSIDSRYLEADSSLSAPPLLSVIFKDRLGWRFHIGRSVNSTDPLASFALSLFRAYMASTVITERLESGSLYLLNQRMTAHRGIRVPGVDGKTLLRRVLLRFEDDKAARR